MKDFKNKLDGTVVSYWIDELAEDNRNKNENFFIWDGENINGLNKLQTQAERKNPELIDEFDELYGDEIDYVDRVAAIAEKAGISSKKFNADDCECLIWSLDGEVAWEYEMEYFKAFQEERLYEIARDGEAYCGLFEDMTDKEIFIKACHENFGTDPVVENWEEFED